MASYLNFTGEKQFIGVSPGTTRIDGVDYYNVRIYIQADTDIMYAWYTRYTYEYNMVIATRNPNKVINHWVYTSDDVLIKGPLTFEIDEFNSNYGLYYKVAFLISSNYAIEGTVYNTVASALYAMSQAPIGYPIEYVTTHCTASGPVEAAIGADVVVAFTPNNGYKLKEISVKDEAGPVPFIRNGNSIAFVMPGPIDA